MTTQFTVTNAATSHNNLATFSPDNPSQTQLIAPGDSRTFTVYGSSSLSIHEGGSANTGPVADRSTQAPAPPPVECPAPTSDPTE